MTVACGGGASGPRTGINSPFVIDPGAALNILSYAGGVGWGLFVGAIDTFIWEPSTDCATDPPGYQTLTLSEVMALVPMNSGSPDFLSAISKLKDNIITALWYQNCQCLTGSQPQAPQIPALPSGSPQPAGSANGTCSDLSWTGVPNLEASSTYPVNASDISAAVLPFVGTPVTVTVVGSSNTKRLYPLPTQKPTQARVLIKVPSGNTHVQQVGFWIGNDTCCGTVGGLSLEVNGSNLQNNDSGLLAFPTTITCSGVTSPVKYYGVDVVSWTSAGGDHLTGPCTVEVQLYGCGAIGPQCCDENKSQPTVNVDTTALSNAIAQLTDLVTIIQRQAAPFAYVAGATHSGLSGSGQITFSDLLGIKITPSSIPNDAGRDIGDPDSLWLDSWIRWGNADGWTQREFLTSAPYVSFPALGGQYTKLGYTLRPGLTIDALELVREP